MALPLDIDAHGLVAPGSDAARRALAERAGRFALLPSAADLLVARRVPASGALASRPRCVLAGDLSGFPLADFLAFMHQSRLTGVLTVHSGGHERSVEFQDGEARGAQSTAPGERIGEIAVRLGHATDAQIAEAARAGTERLGKALVERGAVTANDLWKCLHEQVTEVFHAILLARSGTFFLVDEDAGERPTVPLAVSTQSLLMDGIRRIDEMSHFRARIPGPDAFVRRRDPARKVSLDPDEEALLALVDGRRTVADLAAAARLPEFEATKRLYHLAEAGCVEAAAGPAAESLAPEARAGAVARGMGGLLREVVAAVEPVARPALLAEVRGFLADAAAPFAPVLANLSPAEDGALDEERLLGNVGALAPAAVAALVPSGSRSALVLAALRELLFFYLFLAGERLDRAADDALGRRVKQRLQQLEDLA
jgi:Domain of unknown function (DUF4388)